MPGLVLRPTVRFSTRRMGDMIYVMSAGVLRFVKPANDVDLNLDLDLDLDSDLDLDLDLT